MTTAQPAGYVLRDLRYSVERAVVINPVNAESERHIVCAINTSADLEILTLRKKVGETTLRSMPMNDELSAAAKTFCNVAFARAVDKTEKDE